jgi:Bacterial regulatory protein, Fis family
MNNVDNLIQWNPGIKLEDIEKTVIKKAFKFFHGNKTATSNSLGIAIRTLDNKLEIYKKEDGEQETRENELRKRNEDYYRRARGQGEIEKIDPASPTQGQRVESVVKIAEKHDVSVPKQKKV